MIEQPRPQPLRDAAVSAPYRRFVEGVRRAPGYDVQDEGDRMVIRFEPWFAEHAHPFAAPCVRLVLRKEEERIVLEEFGIEDDGEPSFLNIHAARDALQAWMDYMCD